MTLGERIRFARQRLGMSQQRLASWFQISREAVCQWEADETGPDRKKMPALAKYLEVSLEWLSTGEGPISLPLADPEHGTIPVVGLAECGLAGWYQDVVLAVRTARPPDLVDPRAFAVIAIGTSMQPLGILPGFLVICSPAARPHPGHAVYVKSKRAKRIVASIKEFRSEDADWLYLKGWHSPAEDRSQQPYEEQISSDQVAEITAVVSIKRRL